MRVTPRGIAAEQNSAKWALEVLGVGLQVYLDNPKHLAKKGGEMTTEPLLFVIMAMIWVGVRLILDSIGKLRKELKEILDRIGKMEE